MLKKTIKTTGYAILAGAALTLGSLSLTTSAQAAPLNLNPLPITEIAPDLEVTEVRGRHGFRGHRGGFRGHRGGFRSFNRGHRSGFRGRSFNRGHFKGRHHKSFRKHKFSRHGGFNRGHGFRGHRFSNHSGFGYVRSR